MTPEELLAQSLAKFQTANRIDGTKNSYRKDNPTEYTKVTAYLGGGARPSGVTSDMGMGLMLEEDARRALGVVEPPPTSNGPPPAAGYFTLQPVGAWATLPTGEEAAQLVHRSTWEPRPDNTKRNHIMPNAAAVHASFSSRPRSGLGTYHANWDSWLLPRVDGQFTGTTDEILQWAACKWGLSDNLVRAAATQESTWFQYMAYPSNRCVSLFGCGDFFGAATPASIAYCNHIATFGYDYQKDYGVGQAPQTFSILGIKSYWDPAWGFNWAGNQNGTFPFNRDSTAFAADYYCSQIRGSFEGWVLHSGAQANDIMGSVGMWFSGAWHDAAANEYAAGVQTHLDNRRWLYPNWPSERPGTHPTYGTPGPDTL